MKCETGCISLEGNETRHHKDCVFYPESLTKMYDDAMEKVRLLTVALSVGDTLVKVYELDCGDNSCYFKGYGKGGMRTNGGCRCAQNKPRWVENLAKNMLYKARAALEEIQHESKV
jgi:hypothetical protein